MRATRLLLLLAAVAASIPLPLRAGFEHLGAGSRPLALGGAYCCGTGDPWTLLWNPAGLGPPAGQGSALSFFYAPQMYGVPELARAALAATFPLPAGRGGAAVRRYGCALYRELSFTAGYALEAAGGIDVGCAVHYHLALIEGYGGAGCLGVTCGVLLPVTPSFSWGAAVENLNAPRIGRSREKLPRTLTSGISWHPGENFTLTCDLRKEEDMPPALRCGCDIALTGAVAVRCGLAVPPSLMSGGIALRASSSFAFDYTCEIHPILGATHSLTLTLGREMP